MESQATINLPEKLLIIKIYLRKRSIEKRIIKKLR